MVLLYLATPRGISNFVSSDHSGLSTKSMQHSDVSRRAARVQVTIDDARGDDADTRVFSASIEADGQPAGRVCATLVNRTRPGFFARCDAESDELQAVGTLLFANNGKPRYPPLARDPTVRCGGLLYISDLTVEEDFAFSKKHALAFAMVSHPRLSSSPFRGLQPELVQRVMDRLIRRTEVGAAAIRALLEHETLRNRWSVAAYICEGRKMGKNRVRVRDYREKLMHMLSLPGQTAEEAEFGARMLQRIVAKSRQRMAADARKFIRAGFMQADRGHGRRGLLFLYMTKGRLEEPPLTHSEALAVPLLLDLEEAPGEEEEERQQQRARESRARLHRPTPVYGPPGTLGRGLTSDPAPHCPSWPAMTAGIQQVARRPNRAAAVPATAMEQTCSRAGDGMPLLDSRQAGRERLCCLQRARMGLGRQCHRVFARQS